MRKLLGFAALLVSFYSYSQVSFCGGSSTVISAGNPSNIASPSYSMNPGGVSSSSGNYTISPNANTTYTIYTTGIPTGSTSVITTASVITVTVSPMPLISPSFTQASCTSTNNAFNLNLTFNPPSPVPQYSVQWVNIAPVNITSISQFSAANSAPGPYTTIITAAGGCTTTLTFSINPPPAPANYTVIPFGSSHTITCVTPSVVLNTNNANLTYTWSASSFTPVMSPSITLDATMLGTVMCIGENTVSHCTATYTFILTQDITVPSTTISPTFTTLTCAQPVPPTISVTASPSLNISHFIYSPQGGTFAANAYTAIYYVGGIGEFTHCAVYNNSGCQTCKTFTINSTTAATDFPTGTVVSTQNFTLGCASKSVCPIKISNPQGVGGGATSYTLVGPPTTGTVPATGILSSTTDYSVTVPGTWTVHIRDNVSNCEIRIPVSVTQLTFAPELEIEDILIPKILNCKDTITILRGLSTSTNAVLFNWSFPFAPGNYASSNLTVNTLSASPGQSLVANFTLTAVDQWNLCPNTMTVPVYQNLYKPLAEIAATPTLITCKTPTVTLTNQSASGIPDNSPLFPKSKPIAGLMWYGPSPQEPVGPSSSYLGGVVGIYTLVVMDLNNYCRSTATLNVGDGLAYPSVTLSPNPAAGGIAHIDCGANSATINVDVTNMPTTNLTYTWSGGPNDVQDGGKNKKTYTPDKPGKYVVVVQNTVSGCAKRSDTISVTIGVITSKFAVSTDNGYAPLTVQFTNQSSSVDSVSGASNIQSIWNWGNGDSTYQSSKAYSISPSTVFNQPGTYTVTLYAGKGACMDSSYHVIRVDIPSALDIPNVFTPNDDGVNDFYFLKTSNLSSIEMVIYDRWGHLTYELKSGNGNVLWDGKNQYGKDCAEGTYFYVLKATGKDGTTYDKKGTINLYR